MRHYIDQSLLSGQHRVEVVLVGVGGTGSHVLTGLAKIHHSLVAFDHPGLHVAVYDDDIVSEANVGRQVFGLADVGQAKASVLTSRINGYFGLDWDAYPEQYPHEGDMDGGRRTKDVLITCVDTGKARRTINNFEKSQHNPSIYWLDFGNSRTTGQVILGTFHPVSQPKMQNMGISYLPTIFDLYPDLERADVEDNTPSCSLRESLRAQDLFVNSFIADLGCNLLWNFLKNSFIEIHGFFGDLSVCSTSPLRIDPVSWGRLGFDYKPQTIRED